MNRILANRFINCAMKSKGRKDVWNSYKISRRFDYAQRTIAFRFTAPRPFDPACNSGLRDRIDSDPFSLRAHESLENVEDESGEGGGDGNGKDPCPDEL